MGEIPMQNAAQLGEQIGQQRMAGIGSIARLQKKFPGVDSLLSVGVMNMSNNGVVVDEETGVTSSIGAMPMNVEGQIMLVPTVWRGRRLSRDEAVANAQRMIEAGHPLPTFATEAQAKSVRDLVMRDFATTKDYLMALYPRVQSMQDLAAMDDKPKKKIRRKPR